MDECCTVRKEGSCPKCGKAGTKTHRETPAKHLSDAALEKTQGWSEVHVCFNPDCEVLYFHDASWVSFRESRTRVGFKEKEPPHPLCYCFHHTGEDFLKEIEEHGKPVSVDEIKRQVKEKNCRCEETNPTGLCCLGSINTFLKRAREKAKVSSTLSETGSGKTSFIEKIGLASVLTASACCGIPLLLALLGIGGLGLGKVLGAAHGFLSVLGFTLVGIGFFFYIREKKACAAAGCAMPNRRRTLAVLIAAALFVTGFTAWGSGLFSKGGGKMSFEPDVVLEVTGMTCEGCATHVRSVLTKVPGVREAEVRLKEGKAYVDTEGEVDPGKLEEAVKAIGYGAKVEKNKEKES